MELTRGSGPEGPSGGEPADDGSSGGRAPDARRTRPWGAAAAGASIGLLLATVGILAVELFRGRRTEGTPPREIAGLVDLFRLPSGSEREIFLVPAGPDSLGEPRLAEALYPGELPPRVLASLLVANVGASRPWDLDLGATPLRGRTAGGEWAAIEPVAARALSRRDLPPDLELRLRGVGGAATAARVDPGTLTQILVALPPGRTVGDLSDVQLGDVALVRDRLDLERVRRFRLDPAGTTSGR